MAQADSRFIVMFPKMCSSHGRRLVRLLKDKPLRAPLPACGPHGRDARAPLDSAETAFPCLRPGVFPGRPPHRRQGRGHPWRQRDSASRVIGGGSQPGVRVAEDMQAGTRAVGGRGSSLSRLVRVRDRSEMTRPSSQPEILVGILLILH